MIVINKTDLVEAKQLEHLNELLSSQFPGTKIFNVSARSGVGLEPWFNAVYESQISSDKFLDIDYERYGKGESLLGWLNGSISFSGCKELDGNKLLADLATHLGQSVDQAGAEIAHLKMTINPVGNLYEIAALSLVRGGEESEFSHRLSEPLEDGEILLNIRAESDPELLRETAMSAFDEVLGRKLGLDYSVDHLEHFRPGQPVPTYRITQEQQVHLP